MNYAPPIQRGIFLTVEDGQFHIAVSIRNPTDEEVSLRSMDSMLFHISMKERTFTEEGLRHLWSPSMGAAQAVTTWRLDAGATVTDHYTVPNEEAAREEAREWQEEFDWCDDPVDELMEGPEFQWVEPDNVGVVQVKSTFPATNGYHDGLMRQFDLRSSNRALDAELPPEQRDGIEGLL